MTPAPAFDAGFRQSLAIGTVTPSANLVVERVTAAVLRSFPQVSAHFSRAPVRGEKDPLPDSYDLESMLAAAHLLADAGPDAIVWNGSKGASIGLAADRYFCAEATKATGLRVSTSMLAIDSALRAHGVARIAIVSPYIDAYQARLCAGMGREGYTIVDGACAGVADNLAYMNVPDGDIAAMIRRVAAARPDAILTLCTNFPAAFLVAGLEAELGLPIYDSVLAGVFAALQLAGVDTGAGASWGRLFRESGAG